MSNFVAFKGMRGNFTVSVDGETWNMGAIVFGIEAPDQFQVAHEETLNWRLNEKKHSPTGLEWGYNGSGPAQLAYCMLRESGLTQPQANKIYQQFKAEVVSKLPKSGFTITKDEILAWVNKRPQTNTDEQEINS